MSVWTVWRKPQNYPEGSQRSPARRDTSPHGLSQLHGKALSLALLYTPRDALGDSRLLNFDKEFQSSFGMDKKWEHPLSSGKSPPLRCLSDHMYTVLRWHCGHRRIPRNSNCYYGWQVSHFWKMTMLSNDWSF